MLSKRSKYMPFFDGDCISFFNLMHKYVDDKSYNTSFCDLVLIVMCNALDEDIVIINDSTDDIFVTVLSPRTRRLLKRWGSDPCIFLLKTLDHYDAYIPAYFDLNVNGPTLAGRHFNSFDPRIDELNKGNVPALYNFDNLAINANTTTQVPNREINIPENVTGGQCDNSTLYSHHGDDVTDSNSAPVFSDLIDSVYSHHDDDVTDISSVPVFLIRLHLMTIRYIVIMTMTSPIVIQCPCFLTRPHLMAFRYTAIMVMTSPIVI